MGKQRTASPSTGTGSNTTPQGSDNVVKQSGTTADLVQQCDYQVFVVREPNNLDTPHENLEYEDMAITNVTSIEIRDSLEMLYRTATLTLSNRSSFREIFPITGREIITIVYRNHFHTNNPEIKRKIIHFKIFHIDELENKRERAGNPGAAFLNIHLIEYPMFHFLTTEAVYKSWPIYTKNDQGRKASEYFREAILNIPNFDKHYDLQVEDSYEHLKFHDMWIPGWTAYKIIKYFNQYMINSNDQGYYVFSTLSNEKGKGHKPYASYRSIYSLFETDHFKTYSTTMSDTLNRQPASVENEKGVEKSPEDDVHFSPTCHIAAHKIAYANANRFFHRGLHSRTGLIYDYNEGNQHLIQTYRNYMKNYKTLGMTLPFPEDAIIGFNQWDFYGAYPYQNKEMLRAYMNNCIADNVFKEMFLTAVCPVDTTRFLGEKSAIFLPSTSKDRMIDFQMSGRWIVWKTIDVITANGISTSEVTFARDSYWIQNGDFLEKSKNVYEDEISSFKQRN